ncbi:MAG: DUF3592 domain-containing protein [Gammaproteobacteria bacterium]|nr:DUF3592 domain-containing protein [Gammaproteobacteria bacterium]
MFNSYVIILILFALAGTGLSLITVRNIQRSKQSLFWLPVQGHPHEETKNLKQVIEYTVDDEVYSLEHHIDEFESHNNKQITEEEVTVFYNPDNPQQATLHPGPKQDDWLVLIVGIAAAVFALVLIFLS